MSLYRVRVQIDDVPGRLARTAKVIARLGGDIHGVELHGVDRRRVTDEFLVRFARPVDTTVLRRHLEHCGATLVEVAPIELRELADPVTRALGIVQSMRAAGRDHRSALEAAAAALVRAEIAAILDDPRGTVGDVCSRALADGSATQAREHVKLLPATDPAWVLAVPFGNGGGTALVLARRSPRFSLTEIARVTALTDLARGAGATDGDEAVLSDGGSITLRRLRRSDAAAIGRQHARCSTQTLHRRYLAPLKASPALIERLIDVGGADKVGLVAALGSEVVGSAHAFRFDPTTFEIALLVEDSHQQRGIGTRLLERLTDEVVASGAHLLLARTLPDNDALPALLARTGRPMRRGWDGSVRRLVLDVGDPVSGSAGGTRVGHCMPE